VVVLVEDQELAKQLLTGIGCRDRPLELSGFVVKEIIRICFTGMVLLNNTVKGTMETASKRLLTS
jgi:hypothetical protein